jgi:hypothetical protein
MMPSDIISPLFFTASVQFSGRFPVGYEHPPHSHKRAHEGRVNPLIDGFKECWGGYF